MRTADNGEVPSFDNTGSGMVSDASGGATEAPFLFYAPCPMGATEEPVSLRAEIKSERQTFSKASRRCKYIKPPPPPPSRHAFGFAIERYLSRRGRRAKEKETRDVTVAELLVKRCGRSRTGFCALLGIKTNFSSEHSNSLLP